MSLLLDALQRASKEKEKLAESRGISANSPGSNASVEPVAERGPFPVLAIEPDGEIKDVTLELTMEPIVTETTPPPVASPVFDPVPMAVAASEPDAAMETASSSLPRAPREEVHVSSVQMARKNELGGISTAVTEISDTLAVPSAADVGGVSPSEIGAGTPETKVSAAHSVAKEASREVGDSSGRLGEAGVAPHPSPALSPQVAREILGATAKRLPKRRVIALGGAAFAVAGMYLAFFLGAFDSFFGKSGSSLTPANPPPPVVAVAPAPTLPSVASKEQLPAEGEGGKPRDTSATRPEPAGTREGASLPTSKATPNGETAVASRPSGLNETAMPAARGTGARHSRPVVVARATTTSLLDAAYAAMSAGRLDDAADTYRKALAANPAERDAFLGLAYIAQRKGNNDEARSHYLQVVRLDPANSVANSGLLAIAAEGDLPQAASRAREMAERTPDSAVVMSTLGAILAKEGRVAEAQQAYFRALTLEPENALHAFNLAVALDMLHKNSQALGFYQRALMLAEKSPEAERSGFPFKEARQRVEQLRQSAMEPRPSSGLDPQFR